MANKSINVLSAIRPTDENETIRIKGYVDYDESIKTRAVNFKWESDKSYFQNDVIVFDGIAYQCRVNHTSSTFENDKISKWKTLGEMGNSKNVKQVRGQQVALQTVIDLEDSEDDGRRRILEVDGKPLQLCMLDGQFLKHVDQEQVFPISRICDENENLLPSGSTSQRNITKLDTVFSIEEVEGEELLCLEEFNESEFISQFRDSELRISTEEQINISPDINKNKLSKLGLYIRDISPSSLKEDLINEHIHIDAANTTTNTVSLDASLNYNYPKGSFLIKTYASQSVISTGSTQITLDTVGNLTVGARMLIYIPDEISVSDNRTEEIAVLSIDDTNKIITIQTSIQDVSGFPCRV